MGFQINPKGGSGIRLQATSPGTPDAGNANINGVFIAKLLTTSPNGDAAGNDNENIGHNNTGLVAGHSMLAIGTDIAVNPGNVIFNGMAVGRNLNVFASSCVVFGLGCAAGYGSGSSNYVAMGMNCVAGQQASSNIRSVAMGFGCVADGGQNTVVGQSSQITNTPGAADSMMAFGNGILLNNAGSREMVAVGGGIVETATARLNALVVGFWGGASSGAYPGTVSNSIRIGNTNQATVRIGPLDLTKQMVTGSKASGAALISLLTALASMGLITDSTTT